MAARIMVGATGPVEARETWRRRRAIIPSHSCEIVASTAGVNDSAASSRETLARRPHAATAEGARCGLRLGFDRLRDGGNPGCPCGGGWGVRRARVPVGVGRRRGRAFWPTVSCNERATTLLLDGRRQRTLGHEIKQALSLIRRTYPAMASITARDAHGTATLLLGLEARCAMRSSARGTARASPPRREPGMRRSMPSMRRSGSGRFSRSPPSTRSSCISTSARTSLPQSGRIARSAVSPFAEPDAALGDGPDIEAAKVQGPLALRLSPGVGRLPLRLHRRGALVLHRGGRRVRTNRARAGAQHGRLRGAPRPPNLALIGLEAGRPLRLRAGRSCRSGRSC